MFLISQYMDAMKIDAVKIALAKATLKILKPLIQILMRHDISHGEFSELAKRAYVEVAFKHFSIPSRKTTNSRVAVLTGPKSYGRFWALANR